MNDQATYRIRQARTLEQQGRREEALACYRDLLDLHPQHNDSRYNMARLLRRTGQPEAAIAEYRECLRRGIEQPEEVHNNLGIVLGDLHRHEEARTELREALAINPDYVPALFNLGLLEEEHGRWHQASALFQRVLAVEPMHPGSLARLANGNHIKEPTDRLLRQIKRALRRVEIQGLDREELLYALGKAYDDCGYFKLAFDWYSQANLASRNRVGPYNRHLVEQHVQELVKQCDADWMQRIEPVSDKSHIFICGMFRSGSTLAEQVLAAHPQVSAGGELDYFQQALKTWPDGLNNLETLQMVGDGYEALLGNGFPGSQQVSNKRPDNFLYLGLIAALFPNALIIETRRRPLDNCLSLYFQPMESGQSHANALLDCGHYYTQYQRLMEHWRGLLGGRILGLDYEKLVNDPESTIRNLLDFLSLPWDSRCLEFHNLENRVRTASVHQVRQPLYSGSCGRWQHYANFFEPLRKFLSQQAIRC